ncbi:hypothetical protein, partial [Clostridium thermosuccinogenes]|uniref:hypothetical protein n=1 Tax=Clostridium thermosuccinogenes TaxID=84032 RepID=UPI001A9A4601
LPNISSFFLRILTQSQIFTFLKTSHMDRYCITAQLWMMMCIPMKLRPFSSITAIGIHISSGNKPPKSNWVNALNSFILSVREVDVSQAPTRGLKPLW